MMSSRTRKLTFLAVFTALAMIFSYIESLIPFYFGVPGMKLGIPNICIVVVLFVAGEFPALIVNLLRIFLTAMLFTNVYSLLFSTAGALLSFLLMVLLKRGLKFSPVAVSLSGGIAHNLGQLIAAALVVQEYAVMYYFPALMLAGAVTGFITGLIARLVIPRLKIIYINDGGK